MNTILATFALALTASAMSISSLGAEENEAPAPEVTAAEAEISFRDLTPLEEAYIDTAPAVRDGDFPVGELGVDGGEKANIVELAQEIAEGKHGRYDSLLITHKGQLLFESYYQRGRINLTHPQASAAKAYTSLALGRAIQLGYLTMADLDKPLISFLSDLDRANLVEGAEKITLHKALTMHGDLVSVVINGKSFRKILLS